LSVSLRGKGILERQREFGSKLEPKRRLVGVDDPQLLERIGSPGRTRTCDLVINSEAGDLRIDMYDDLRARDSEGW